MPRPDHEAPQFAAALRGYDRDQVDDYIATLQGFLQEAQDRALEAEQRTVAVPHAGQQAAVEQDTTDAVPLVPAARAVQGLPQRLADAVREAVEAAERAGAALVADVEHERATLTEGTRAAREQAHREAERIVGEASAEADRLVREAAAAAEHVRRHGLEQDRQRRAAAEEELTTLRQRADQEQARRDHTIRQIEVLRRSLEAATRPDTGSLANALFGSDPAPAREQDGPQETAEPPRGSRRVPEAQEADTDVLGGEPQQARAAAGGGTQQARAAAGGGTQQAPAGDAVDPYGDPYGDRTQVLRVVE